VAGKEYTGSVKSLKKKQKALNDLPALDYEEVMKLKLNVIQDLFQLQKDKVFASEEYNNFFAENKDWLVPYAVFSYLRDKYNSPDFRKWKTYSVYNEEQIQKLASSSNKHYDKIAVQYFTQFHLHLQLQEAHDYAGKNGVIVKGDIPIGINRNGVDAWMSPELYYMDQQAGAATRRFCSQRPELGFSYI
jgi:4-alpha-glucanotransferase